VTDRKGALHALERCKPNLRRVRSLLCDSGYTGKSFAQGVRDLLGEEVSVQIAKRSELHTFKVMPKRWIVERSFAWLEKNEFPPDFTDTSKKADNEPGGVSWQGEGNMGRIKNRQMGRSLK
jgi:transposase